MRRTAMRSEVVAANENFIDLKLHLFGAYGATEVDFLAGAIRLSFFCQRTSRHLLKMTLDTFVIQSQQL